MTKILEKLVQVIASRRHGDKEKSWTAKLLSAGPNYCARKFGEEAIELIVASANGNADEIKSEAADVLFHLLVLLESRGISLSEILDILEARQGISGIDEKKSRKDS
jgi:phosphoribosyl-ATP pyrophosphohydrolase